MIVFDCRQGSEEWFNHRKGLPTASSFHRIITTKGKPSAGQELYIAELIAEEVSPNHPSFHSFRPTSRAMDEGTENEHAARCRYELETGLDVRQVGFCKMESGIAGGSPDGLVGGTVIAQKWVDGQGGVELKNPDPKQHVKYVLKGKLPNIYKAQVHGHLVISGLPWWDFCSVCDDYEPLIIRVERDEFTDLLAAELVKFWDRLQESRKKLIPSAKLTGS